MKKFTVALIFFILVFAAVAFSLTHFLILTKDAPKAEVGIDLNGTFDENDLLIEYTEETDGDFTIRLPRIKGLKNKLVQTKINRDISLRAQELLEKHPDSRHIGSYCYSNFANTISLTIDVGFDEAPYYENIYLNYNLTDGSLIAFEDLFKSDTDVLEIVRKAFYESLSLYGTYDSETYVHSPVEENLFKTVKGFMSKDEKSFVFTSTSIYIHYKDNMATIDMMDYYDDITIYSKFMTKRSIFTGEYKGFENAFTCSNINYDLFDSIEYGYIEDNLWYDISVTSFSGYDQDAPAAFTQFKDKIVDGYYTRLKEYRRIAKSNPDTFFIVLMKPSVSLEMDSEYVNNEWQYTYYDTARVYSNVQILEMPIELHEKVYRDKIVENYRYEYFSMRGGAYFNNEDLQGADFTEHSETSIYNYYTGELISKEEY